MPSKKKVVTKKAAPRVNTALPAFGAPYGTNVRDALRPKKPVKLEILKLATAPIQAWSLSRIKLYEQCPRACYYKHVAKLPEAQGPAMLRGDLMHKAIEKYIRFGGAIPKTVPIPDMPVAVIHPKSLTVVAWLRKEFMKRNANAEYQIAVNRDWKQTGYFDADVYGRMQADALDLPKAEKEAIQVIDWKSGQIREGEYDDTLELYALSVLSIGAGASAVGSLVFLDHGVEIKSPKTMTLKDLPRLQKKWDERARPMLSDKRFAPRPSNKCCWCAFSASKNGPCPY